MTGPDDPRSETGNDGAPEDEAWSPDNRRRMLLSRFTPVEIKRLFGDESTALENITQEAGEVIRSRFTPSEIELLFGNEGAALEADITPEMDKIVAIGRDAICWKGVSR